MKLCKKKNVQPAGHKWQYNTVHAHCILEN